MYTQRFTVIIMTRGELRRRGKATGMVTRFAFV